MDSLFNALEVVSYSPNITVENSSHNRQILQQIIMQLAQSDPIYADLHDYLLDLSFPNGTNQFANNQPIPLEPLLIAADLKHDKYHHQFLNRVAAHQDPQQGLSL
ncbi:hypothetical protein [Lacticaseibacillus saniviri]|uniref:Uncharacterized protein n=1 Tax=Lacticaseibacillus saniviri JCM 17471 = DSM 24301 TaxID=1293598 RepID=A0A0R2MSJ9_9LACO|nr:hypothetical protein [Lacticaseibacillus saniviri]KRO16457.1 hypothetical protein IV56_GL001240 [Lacticaseibacillus saniviri JCM 17471 = DSM 24301]MCG4282028.1 hypothetical protein [Lacticaseibacillus saniviri]